MERENIKKVLERRILVLDGAMGTMIQRYNLTEDDFRKGYFENHPKPLKGNNDILVLTRPDVITEIHEAYLEAGADIIETNTFASTSIAQKDYGLEDKAYEINKVAAILARNAADKYTAKNPAKPRYVAGSIGPTNMSASLSPDVNDPGYRSITFDQLVESYKEQARGLLDGGSDVLLIETIFDTLNAKAALYAIQELYDEIQKEYPIMVSGTITDASGRTLSGQTTEAFLISVSHFPILSVGLNCALGARQLHPYLKTLDQEAPFYTSAHPNAGLPNEFGEYDQTPGQMGKEIESFLKEGLLNIVGGCCGTTPEHIKEISQIAARYQPRKMYVEE